MTAFVDNTLSKFAFCIKKTNLIITWVFLTVNFLLWQLTKHANHFDSLELKPGPHLTFSA